MLLTTKEKQLLETIKKGMDEPNCGWLHELSPWDTRTTSGVISSLIRKGLIDCDEDREGPKICYWVSLKGGK